MIRIIATIALGCLLLACHRGKSQAVTVVPRAPEPSKSSVPADPFGSASAAYAKLKEVTDEALASTWNGTLEDFAPWLEEQTVAVERALNMLKALRVGQYDLYAVGNGRVALVYEQIAEALTQASVAAEAAGHDADWKGQEARIWAQAGGYWARCVRGCALGGTHLDAWDLRCRAGLEKSQAKLGP